MMDQRDWLRAGLRAIAGPTDSGPFIDAYRAAGGGYEGLQAIAEFTLRHDDDKVAETGGRARSSQPTPDPPHRVDCIHPEKCAGLSSCPRKRACSE